MHLLLPLVLQQIVSPQPELSTNLLNKYVQRKFFIYLSIKIKMGVSNIYSMSKIFIYCIVILKLIEGVVVRRLQPICRVWGGRAGRGGRHPRGRCRGWWWSWCRGSRWSARSPAQYCTVQYCSVLYCTVHHVPDEVDEEVLYQAALPHLPLLLGGGGAGQSRGGEEAEAQENGLEVTLSTTSFTWHK